MQTLYTVIDDVYAHTVGAALSALGISFDTTLTHANRIAVPEKIAESAQHGEGGVPHAIPSGEPFGEELGPPTMRALSTVLAQREPRTDSAHTVGYIASAETPLFGAPTKDFDTVITRLGYGTMVMLLEEKGRFSRIAQNGMTGWVLRDDLVDRAAHVYPEFVVGSENHADDPNTLRTRACIKDAFHGGEAECVLQSGEYVLYRLVRKGQNINWPPTRPRVPGRWHTILKGVPGISIGIVPKNGSCMEYSFENDVGHLAYVEAVFPDDRITISEVNNPDNGMYNERTLTKEEWQVHTPIFISVT